jgi:broad specificity phosphatase PhoE
MKIIFIRHDKPAVPEFGKLNGNEFQQWITAYNQASLDTGQRPPSQLINLEGQCKTIVCSDLRRSIESAELLGIQKIDCMDTVFREVELPYCRKPTSKLSPGLWSVIFRVLWFMGYAPNCESKVLARQRAVLAADILEKKALSNDTVVLIGHSIFNSFIGK